MKKQGSLYFRIRKSLSEWLTRDLDIPAYPLSDFDRIKHELKMGDVILIEGSSRISKAIRNLTHSTWTHSALYIGRIHDIEDVGLRKIIAHHYSETSNGKQLMIEGMMGEGTIVSPIEKYRKSHMRICRPTGISHPDAQKVVAFSIKALGMPYHIRRIVDMVRFLLPWSILPRHWVSTLFSDEPTSKGEVCSSLIARAFTSINFPILPLVQVDKKTGKVNLLHRNYRLFTPSDFDYSPYFEIIKYPMFNLTDEPDYRELPWVKHTDT